MNWLLLFGKSGQFPIFLKPWLYRTLVEDYCHSSASGSKGSKGILLQHPLDGANTCKVYMSVFQAKYNLITNIKLNQYWTLLTKVVCVPREGPQALTLPDNISPCAPPLLTYLFGLIASLLNKIDLIRPFSHRCGLTECFPWPQQWEKRWRCVSVSPAEMQNCCKLKQPDFQNVI